MRRWLSDAEYRYINSSAFLRSSEWALARQDAIRLNDGRCECCKRAFGSFVPLNVDHVNPRATHPHLALNVRFLQCLCGPCNAAKCNSVADYRSFWHPYRITWWRRLWRWINS